MVPTKFTEFVPTTIPAKSSPSAKLASSVGRSGLTTIAFTGGFFVATGFAAEADGATDNIKHINSAFMAGALTIILVID
jgi:hypothetical protein